MTKSIQVTTFLFIAAIAASAANAADIFPVFTDVNAMGTGFQDVVTFADAPGFGVDSTAMDGTNEINVYSQLATPTNNGYGFTISASNGENGKDSSEGGANTDVPNPHTLNSVISSVNGGSKIKNGNVFRLSAWLRQDPNDPITAVPQIEPVFKIELWKEAAGSVADFNAAEYPGGGDRIWDTDQNGGSGVHPGNGQSQASWVDLNNSGSTSFSKPVATSLVTSEWRLVETTLVIDDDPEDDSVGWSIGNDPFTVADIEEVRGVMYSGDFASTDFTGGAGSIWVDNILFEVFADEAAMNASPNANPNPGAASGLVCALDADMDCDIADLNMLYAAFGSTGALDLDGSGTVDSGDIDVWLTAASDPSNTAKLNSAHTYENGDVNLDGSVDSSDLGVLLNNFGDTTGKGFADGNLTDNANIDSSDLGVLLNNFGHSSLSAAAVPEPSSAALVLVALLGMCAASRRRR